MVSSSTVVKNYQTSSCPTEPLSIGEYLIERLQDMGSLISLEFREITFCLFIVCWKTVKST